MNILGVKLTLLIGPTVPLPAPQVLTEHLDRVEVTQTDEGRSGFQIVFRAGRSGPAGALDYQLISNPLLKQHNRVVVMVFVNAIPRVLMDGIIKHQQLNPNNTPGATTLTVTGEDISVMMDQKEVTVEHPAQNEMVIALKLIAQYAQYGLIPMVLPPFLIDFPIPIERTPVQRDTDLKYLQALAGRFGYVFYIKPGPAPLTNTAYWGPPIRMGLPARALSMNLGPETNVDRLDFQYNAREATRVEGRVRDRNLNADLPVLTFASTRVPPLAAFPPLPFELSSVRTTQLTGIEGLTYAQAFARAQSITNKSMDNVLTATGEADATRYGDVLEARGLVGVRGAGYSYDGFYYVKSVTHAISSAGEYKQRFTLTREGKGSTTPVVRP
jgi:hypothetical protein